MNKVTFILGAGASAEVDLPVGVKLKENISNLLKRENFTSSDIYQVVGHHLAKRNADEINKYIEAAGAISKAMPLNNSIDNFIESRKDDIYIAKLAKMAIAQSIIQAERSSKLFFKNTHGNNINFSNITDTWFVEFFKVLTSGKTIEEVSLRLKNTNFVIFNYDRCFEHFLHNSLTNNYEITYQQATDLINSINIYRPYGTIGKLFQTGNNICPGYGRDENFMQQLDHISNNIKTFTESVDSNEVSAIQECISSSETLIFLGFHFHPQNMKLISSEVIKNTTCLATTYGMSSYDSSNVRNYLISKFKIEDDQLYSPHIECYKLFQQYNGAIRW